MNIEQTPEYNCELQNFRQYYEEHIKETINAIESRRKKFLTLFMLMCAGVLYWIIYLFTNPEAKLPGLLMCAVILAICYPMFSYYKRSKQSLLPLIVGYFGEFEYGYKEGASNILLEKSMIIKKHDDCRIDDSFLGEYQNVPVLISEYTLGYYKKSSKENRISLVYNAKNHGIIFTAKMNKKFKGQTIVAKDKGLLNMFTRYKNMQRVGLESVEFEKAYEVYADDQIEARYILTTPMVDCMVDLKKVFREIEYSFFDEQILVNIKTPKNLFECSHFFISIANQKRIENIFTQFYLLFSIITILKLNQKQLL